jgi:membrane fusion protein (multidrug efflux system)
MQHKIKHTLLPRLRQLALGLKWLGSRLLPYLKRLRPMVQWLINFIFKNPDPNKRAMRKMLALVIGIALLIFSYKAFMGYMMGKFMAMSHSAPITVSTIDVKQQPWEPKLKASGSLRAIRGINLTSEVAGIISDLRFAPGANVDAGSIVIELSKDAELARLKSLEAQAELAAITFQRNQDQFKVAAVSKAGLDAAAADLKSKEANVREQQVVVAKKCIKAPFSGKLGIFNVSVGQYINPGEKLVSLEALDQLYVDFYVPQQLFATIAVDQKVVLRTDTYPDLTFHGKIATIDPQLNLATRNIRVQALIDNKEHKLLPGMFAALEVLSGETAAYLTVPQTAVIFNSYGNIIYTVVGEGKKLQAHQVFVVTGPVRGDQIAILSGLKAGDTIITSGQLKLHNGSPITVNNTITPANNPAPKPVDH